VEVEQELMLPPPPDALDSLVNKEEIPHLDQLHLMVVVVVHLILVVQQVDQVDQVVLVLVLVVQVEQEIHPQFHHPKDLLVVLEVVILVLVAAVLVVLVLIRPTRLGLTVLVDQVFKLLLLDLQLHLPDLEH
jgi:hypothetical protein